MIITKKKIIEKTFFPNIASQYSEYKYPIYKKDDRTIPYYISKPEKESPYYILFSHGNAQNLEGVDNE